MERFYRNSATPYQLSDGTIASPIRLLIPREQHVCSDAASSAKLLGSLLYMRHAARYFATARARRLGQHSTTRADQCSSRLNY